jgi:hypothetical protein
MEMIRQIGRVCLELVGSIGFSKRGVKERTLSFTGCKKNWQKNLIIKVFSSTA